MIPTEQPGMAPSIYKQPGPRTSTGQMQTQFGNFTGPTGTGKRTGQPQPQRRPRFGASTQPFTPTSSFRGVPIQRPMTQPPVFPGPVGPYLGSLGTPFSSDPLVGMVPGEPWVLQSDGSYENRETGEKLPKGSRVPIPVPEPYSGP